MLSFLINSNWEMSVFLKQLKHMLNRNIFCHLKLQIVSKIQEKLYLNKSTGQGLIIHKLIKYYIYLFFIPLV